MSHRDRLHATLTPSIAEKKQATLGCLEALHVPTVLVRYVGENDLPDYKPALTSPPGLSLMIDKPVHVGGRDYASLNALLHALLEEVLDLHHGDWRADVGGMGCLTINLRARTFSLFHQHFLLNTVNTTTEV